MSSSTVIRCARARYANNRGHAHTSLLSSLSLTFSGDGSVRCACVRAFGLLQAEDVTEEVDSMMEGGSWVDWNDGRTT